MIIAIQPDNYGERDASSRIWVRLLESAGHRVREVNVYRADILDQLSRCDAFMWRWAHVSDMRQIARRLLPVIERELGLAVYPDQNTCWHYDDKIAQYYLLSASGIPIPQTWVWHDATLAKEWAQTARYPLVLKLWGGAASANVRLLTSEREATLWIDRLFTQGVSCLDDFPPAAWRIGRRRMKAAAELLLRGIPPVQMPSSEWFWDRHKNYVLLQEFLPGNGFDTRVTVIGNRAFGFRRFNRDNDFRASGSGRIDHDPAGVALDFVRLAFQVAKKLRMQSCAIDGLLRGSEPVIGEISYTYISWAVHDCPGHWELNGDDLSWRPGQMWPEEAQVQDFLQSMQARAIS